MRRNKDESFANTMLFNNVFSRHCWSTCYLWSFNTLLNIIGTEHDTPRSEHRGNE